MPSERGFSAPHRAGKPFRASIQLRHVASIFGVLCSVKYRGRSAHWHPGRPQSPFSIIRSLAGPRPPLIDPPLSFRHQAHEWGSSWSLPGLPGSTQRTRVSWSLTPPFLTAQSSKALGFFGSFFPQLWQLYLGGYCRSISVPNCHCRNLCLAKASGAANLCAPFRCKCVMQMQSGAPERDPVAILGERQGKNTVGDAEETIP